MTTWCSSCGGRVRAPCGLPHHLPEHEHGHEDEDGHEPDRRSRMRSTKGASKARRDHINHEIRNMRTLLPIAQEDEERLSYLHSMAAICTYIRKSVLFRGLPAGEGPSPCSLPYEAFLQALHGFVLVTTGDGRLVYVSENVDEYLGQSMIDVLQADSFYDMVEHSDVDSVKSNLDVGNNSSSERSFVCCMQTSKAFRLQRGGGCCSMLVRGSFRSVPRLSPSSSAGEHVFVALCTPTADRLTSSDSRFCHSFTSVHGLDMTFTRLSDSVIHYLGCSAEELTGRSWYGLVHPDDLSPSAESHRSLMETDEGFQVEMVLRLQRQDLSWTWIYTRANREHPGIRCTNYVISETEARFLQERVGSDAFGPSALANSCHLASQQSPHSQTHGKRLKRKRSSDSWGGEEPGGRPRRESEQDACYAACVYSPGGLALVTPPYSPDSCGSPPLQRDEIGRDLLMDVHGYVDRLLSSPEASPSYYSYPEAALTCGPAPSDSLPAAAQHAFDSFGLGARSALSSSSSSSSSPPPYDFQSCSSDARLVPDCLSDFPESPVDCALHQDDGFSLLEQPEGGSVAQAHHHVPRLALPPAHPGLLTPDQSPPPAESNEYNEREQAEISILAQQISSLARSFDMYHTLSPLQSVAPDARSPVCDWARHPPLPSALPLKCELVLDDGVFDSILKDLDMVPRKSSSSASGPPVVSYSGAGPLGPSGSSDPLSAGQFTDVAPFGLQMGCHDQNTGLHQLNHYMQSGLQRDGLAEENLF